MDALTLIVFAAGLALLAGGAELLVRGAASLAGACGISPLVIGLTVVALGTSSPELAVSVQSAMKGQADLAVGNVVGSNIFNILLILGMSALIVPLVVARQLVRLDVPVMIGVSLMLPLCALDGRLGRGDGALLAALLVLYTLLLIRKGRRAEVEDDVPAPRPAARRLLSDAALVVGGLALLVLGSRWLVQSALVMARALGVSELVIGLTIIAAGTSLPEVATSLVAAVRGQRDIAVGNVVGSNILNILAVLGLTSLAAPGGLAVSGAALRFDIPVMIGVAVACLPIFFTGARISRWEGLLFLGYYAAYTVRLLMGATGHASLPAFDTAMLYFVIPLTAVTLGLVSWRAWRAGARSATGKQEVA